MFIQRADNLAKLILTFANWEYEMQYFYAVFSMIDNGSHVSC